jgi:hypothetical protein
MCQHTYQASGRPHGSPIKASDRASERSLVPETCMELRAGGLCLKDQVFGKLRPTSHWYYLRPHTSMAPVLAMTDMVAIARRDDSLLLTPMERFLNLILTGPNRIPFSHEGEPEMRVDRRWRTRKDEEGMGTTVAVQRRGWGTGSAEIG